jgi:hypothetical protein
VPPPIHEAALTDGFRTGAFETDIRRIQNMRQLRALVSVSAACGALWVSAPALAGAHTWVVNELFSNEDGSIQFIELWEAAGGPGEIFLGGLHVMTDSGSDFQFPPGTLAPPTTNKHILLATQSFADLPGAPTPNHIIPPNFFDPTGDIVSYHTYDDWPFGAGEVPTNCVDSLHRNIDIGQDPSPGPNSPTNYAGATGSVDACPVKEVPGDLDGDMVVDFNDLLILLAGWGDCLRTGPVTCPADLDQSGSVGFADLLILLANWTPT